MTCNIKELVSNCSVSELEKALRAKKDEQFNMIHMEFRSYGSDDTLFLKCPLLSADFHQLPSHELRRLIAPGNLKSVSFFYDELLLSEV
jgi:hypothetical protein